jgi:FkbM family methyltransferase
MIRSMNWRTHPLAIWCRGLARRAGLTRTLARWRPAAGYEDRFQRAMFDALRPGDCVWDVGANVGHYSTRFADCVGPSGHVLSFEPSPLNFVALRQRVGSLSNVTTLPLALGERTGSATFQQGADPLGATSRITQGGSADCVSVAVTSGSDLVLGGRARKPNVIKIDTEGHELEVLLGLGELLLDPELRVLCVEVHFALLAERGLAQAPRRIEKALLDARFAVSWPDASHLVAERVASRGPLSRSSSS